MVGTFPLNVQAGSPQYTLASEITPTSSTTVLTITSIDPIEPTYNAYYTIQNEDGSKWCTFYVESLEQVGDALTYTGTCIYSSSNTSDVFPKGSICWCIWCKEYYDSLVSKIGGGNTIKVSQLEWDTNLVIPNGKVIESASGDVGIVGDMSVSGTITAPNANITTPVLNNKKMVNILLPLQTPISVTSSARSFTVNNPYNTNVTVTISGTGSRSNPAANDLKLDGVNMGFYINPGETDSTTRILSPGNHTISQDYRDTITVTGNNMSVYVFN